MKVNIAPIMEQKGASLDFNLETKCPPLELQQQEVTCIEPLRLAFTLTNTGECILLQGRLETALQLTCDRCLQPTVVPVTVPLSEEFYRAKESELNTKRATAGDSFNEEDDDTDNWYTGDTIDLSSILKDSILLGLPMKVLCHPECAGICHICGKNRNEDQCQCAIDDIDPRLAGLRELLEDAKEKGR
ncbi:MAG: YceD family protein [Limnochordia bacterium]|jgi:uncharacterized protein|nr:DUF177 domain-containing protein [Bacillota bacterium]